MKQDCFKTCNLRRQKTVTQSSTGFQPVMAHIFTYNEYLQLTNEILETAVPSRTNIIVRTYDSLSRPSGFALNSAYSVTYGYAVNGRFSSLSSIVYPLSSNLWQYSYLPNSDLIFSISNSVYSVNSVKTYEPNRNLITEIHNQAQGVTISKYDYTNDVLGRRTQRIDTTDTVTANSFAYNDRSELISAMLGLKVARVKPS